MPFDSETSVRSTQRQFACLQAQSADVCALVLLLQDKFDRSALHWAAETNSIECAEALMDYGCDPGVTECNGR